MPVILLGGLAAVSIVLLIYEVWTLIGSVLAPLWRNPQALQTDFHYYYDAAVRFSQDRSQLYLTTDDVIAGFTYPPPAIVPFVLLASMPFGLALAALTVASYGALIAAVGLWRDYIAGQGMRFDRGTFSVALLVSLASGPTYVNAVFGQVNAFVLLASVGFITLAGTWPIVAGIVLAAGMWLKVYPALLMVSGAWDRRLLRPIAFAVGSAIVVALVLLPVVPIDAYTTFVGDVLPARIDKTAIHITNQSLVAFLERFRFPPYLFLNWTGEQAVTVSAVARSINVVVAVSMMIALGLRAHRGDLASSLAGLMALVAVAAPLGWGHTYMLVLPLLMLHVVSMRGTGNARAIVIFACALALLLPPGRRLPIEWLPGWLQNVAYSRYLIATLALMCLTRRHERRI